MNLEPFCIRNNKNGYEFYIKQPNFQGIYISNISRFIICIDSDEIDKDNIWIGKSNIEIPIEHLCIMNDEYWDVNETVKIAIRNCNVLTEGNHEVKINLTYLESDRNNPTSYREVNVLQRKMYVVDDRFVIGQ